ncbi:cytochrome P450 4c21-like isoform X2 [Macrosteles quadrilineatus]|nr:cytochrome P450 4c21-like isoform X2 [Macrosteles quadrilineatus]
MLDTIFRFAISLGLYGLLLVAGFWIWFQWSNRELLRIASKIPVALPRVPILGHALFTMQGPEEMARSILEMSTRAIEKGLKYICFWVGPLPLIVLQDMDDISTILNGQNTSDKADEYDYFITGLDSGVGPFRKNILSSRGAVWKVTRKHMNPMFHPRNVQHMVPTFNTNSRELVERMSHHLGNGPFNVLEYTMDLGLKSICNLIFGPKVEIDVNAKGFKGLMYLVEAVPEIFIKRLLKPWLKSEFLFRLLNRSQLKGYTDKWLEFSKTPLKVCSEELKQKREGRNITNINELHENLANDENKERINFFDVYSILQQNYPDFTEADLRCEIVTLYCTGTDTIGSGTASCLLALAQYQDVQERLYKEICSVVGPDDDDVTLEDLSNMPYLEMVIKETLRRFLTVPFLLRKLTKDVDLSEMTLPAGTAIVCNLSAIHMNPKLYPNPTEFDPERFAPECSAGKEKFAYVPFSGGPRICIAKTYAMNLMKIEVIHVLRKFKLSTTQDIQKMKRKLIVTLVSTEGYNISLERRNPNKQLTEND